MRIYSRTFWPLLAFLSFASVAAAKSIPSGPRSYVYDEKGVLSDGTKKALFQALASEDQKNGNQILVAFFDSLEGEEMVSYTTRVFEAWRPGEKEKNNGLLIAAYLKERKIRIEVGYGLEPVITDAISKRIILEDLTPAFKAGNYDLGALKAVSRVINTIHGKITPAAATTENGKKRKSPLARAIFLLLFTLVLPFVAIFGRRQAGWTVSSHRRGGFGGFGGGGFGGGGGMSGGGGASGGW